MSGGAEVIGKALRLCGGRVVDVVRYTREEFGPGRPDGSDRDGDFWEANGNCIGKPGIHFEWVTPQGSDHILAILIAAGRITQSDVDAAMALAQGGKP